MKTITTSKTNFVRSFSGMLFVATLLLIFPGCYKGSDGLDGRAFMSINWEKSRPTLIDAGTSSFPSVFDWGRFYETSPGRFYFYYEGKVFSYTGTLNYAWEMEYEIYRIKGEHGGWGYDGENAPDAFFTILCRPEGPSFVEQTAYKNMEISSDTTYVIERKNNGYGIKITVRKK